MTDSARGVVAVDTLVVGAGPSGLAVAACLGEAGVDYAIVDRAAAVGAAWRTHYRRLHLHTARSSSSLPRWPMPRSWPTYPSRAQVVEYLDGYARHFGLAPRLGATVTRARREGGAWRVDVAPGPGYRARHLVVATGYNGVPRRPDIPGLDAFPGEVVHSAAYGDGARFSGREVLVVGVGNSGAEIAIDLHEHGARPSLVVRSPVHVVPRDVLGLPAQRTAIALARLPPRVQDRLTAPLIRLVMGDLSRFGFERPARGPVELLTATGRVPLIDVGTVRLVKEGKIRVTKGVERVDGDVVRFVDGARARFDAIVLATGYRAALERFLDGAERVVDARGYPTVHGAEAQLPGLFFCGFRNPPTGALRESALEAERVAAAIAGRPRG